MAEQPFISVRILPFSSSFYPGVEDFVMFKDGNNDKCVVYTENAADGVRRHSNKLAVGTFLKLLEKIREHSLDPEMSLKLINELIEESHYQI